MEVIIIIKEKYEVLWNSNIKIGDFIRIDDFVTYIPFHEGASTLPEGIGYPDGLFEMDRSSTPWKVIKNKPSQSQQLVDWIQQRVFPKERENAAVLLKQLNLETYDFWEIIKYTKGVSLGDSYSILLINFH